MNNKIKERLAAARAASEDMPNYSNLLYVPLLAVKDSLDDIAYLLAENERLEAENDRLRTTVEEIKVCECGDTMECPGCGMKCGE